MPIHLASDSRDPDTIREAARLLLVYAALSSAAHQRQLKERLIARAADLLEGSAQRETPRWSA